MATGHTSESFQIFALLRAKQVNDDATNKGVALPADLLLHIAREWDALPKDIKRQCEAQALLQEKQPAIIKAQRSLPQSLPHDPPPLVSKRTSPTRSNARTAVATPPATQQLSPSASSTTPSPSVPLSSPYPFCSSPPIPFVYQSSESAATPARSQPELLNTDDNRSSVRYGTRPEVAFLIENHASHTGGRQTATKQGARPHPYDPTGVSTPRLHGSQTQHARKAPLRRAQTVLDMPSTQQTPYVLLPGGNVVRRYNSVPSVVASSNTSNAHQVVTPINPGPVAPSGEQLPHTALFDLQSSVQVVGGIPAVPAGARQPGPSRSITTPHVNIAARASPVSEVQVQTPAPILGDTSIYTPSTWPHVQTTPAHAAVPLPSTFDHFTPAQTDATITVPVAMAPPEYDATSPRPLSSQFLSGLGFRIPTPVPDVVDVDAFLSAILSPQPSTAPLPEFGVLAEHGAVPPDPIQCWQPDLWSGHASDWWTGHHATGWEDLNGFREQQSCESSDYVSDPLL
ncbi:hypothetical protein LXA43DRAFT_997290 [Ganoderma leucocontextum]|nr:hypothetical protein LXA43DRAFT_997290 [Ganoderma leucocontextum]